MAEKSSMKVPEFLREPLEAAQARLAEFEGEAQKVFKDLVQKGKASRKDVAVLVHRLSKQDWHMDELKGHVAKLREQGMERAQELRGRAESFRSEAMEKLEDLQGKAVAFLGVATREQVEELSSELERLARRLDKADRARKARKTGAKRPSAEV
jgi:polyhydroxyalkanoate synthesis regulator phasin